MDGSVAAALITSGVALVVAVGNGVRGTRRATADRRYERRRAALLAAQDAALAFRVALAEYGAALRTRTVQAPPGAGGFVMSVPDPLSTAVQEAAGRLEVARSRVESAAITAALDRWQALARISLIDPRDGEAAGEERAFAEVNRLIGAALASRDAQAPV
ncbi:MAG TPA: hypothetical protein VHC23_12035 [Jatrophihabitans sp.]|nr:hypothetical protein [Jatrophihabitans sp.]